MTNSTGMPRVMDWIISWVFPNFETSYVEWDYTLNPTMEPFTFERDYTNLSFSRKWWWENSYLVVQIAVTYIIGIFGLAWWMKNRKPYNLRKELFVWNLLLAVFSAVGWSRVFSEFLDVISGPNGFHRSVCVRDTLNISSGFWLVVAHWSKLAEFVDTIFIVLRKRPLTFLHVYHHAVTYVLCVSSFVQGEPINRYYGSINFLVHTAMYTYFALSAIDYKPPRRLAMCLTAMQVFQFAFIMGVHFYAIGVKLSGQLCAISNESSSVTLMVSISYFVLFSHFFYRNYLRPNLKSNELKT